MKRITELRKEAKLNQTGLAMKLNVSQKMVSAYETGTHQPSIEVLRELSRIFGVSVDYIIENSDIKAPADKFSKSGLTDAEIELLDLFKELDKDSQQKAIGILFALRHYNK